MSNKINLTIATDINGKGGVSSVLNVLQEHHFFLETKTKLIVSHRNSAKLNTFKQLFTFFTCILKLLFNIAFFDVGLVHIHMASRGSYTRKAILIRIAHFFKVKIIIHLHGAEFEHFYNTECIDSKKKHIRETFNMANKVIVLSSQWLDWLSTILDDKSKGVVIYNAVPFLTLDKSKQSDFFNFVFLGRLGERKGVADLISAFGDVVKNYPDARLLLGGDGELTRFNDLVCSLGLKDKVIFLGWVSGNEKLEILKKANSFVLPSYNEGFPMGVLEAMSCNIPVIASKAGGIPDAISSGEEGLLIDAGDIKALTNAMIFSIEAPQKIKVMQVKAFNKYLRMFSPEIVIPQITDVYKELGAV